MMRVTSSAFLRSLSLALAVAALLVLGSAGSALAQTSTVRTGRGAGSGGPLGVGINAMLAGPFGGSVVYDTGVFHLEGILAFSDNDTQTTFDLDGRFWYHINASQAADFSLGGGLGIFNINPDVGDSTTDVEIDAGAQVRVFIVPNVALSASVGLAIVTGDNSSVALAGNPAGDAGITYFF